MCRRMLVAALVGFAATVCAATSDEEDYDSDADILATAALTSSVAIMGERAWKAWQVASKGSQGTHTMPQCANCSEFSDSESESDDEAFLRAATFRPPRTPSTSRSAPGLTSSRSSTAQAHSSAETPQVRSVSSFGSQSAHSSNRGTWSRTDDKGKRMKWDGAPDSQLQQYLHKVRSGQLIGELKCSCCASAVQGLAPPGPCKDNIQTRILKKCAELCYGETVLVTGETQISNHKAGNQWFKLVYECRVVDPQTGRVKGIDYKVQGIEVCKSVFGACYGMTNTTFDSIVRRVEAGDHAWKAARKKSGREKEDEASMFLSAVAWWMSIFHCFDNTTKRGHLIYDVRNWSTTYEDEFIPTMKTLGFSWRSQSRALDENGTLQHDLEGDHSSSEFEQPDEYGSKSTWYRARNIGLQRFADKTYGLGGARFKLFSRAKHSAYKECTECQANRIGKADAIRNGEPFEIIDGWTAKQAAHVRWFKDQRYAMEAFRQAGGRGNWLVFEQADKCGDSSLYLPGSGRISSKNAGKYTYHVALQANIFPGKLINGYLLLPSLRTGANFGATSFLFSLCNAIKAGSITRNTTMLLRGSDGGSENVGFTMHGVHINLVRVTKKELIWARLPPDHSHDYCDRWFSAVEGFVKDAYAKGVNTIGQLLRLLADKHKGSEYRNMRLHLSILLCNYNFDAWLEGCLLPSDKVKGIKTPLVYKYHWDAEAQTVRVYYKHSIAAESTFEREEWGPWQNVWVEAADQSSGLVQKVQVKRTVPEGVQMEVAVPDFSKSPGFEAWLEDEDWSRERVFSDISKWQYDTESIKYKAVWSALGHWHSVNRLARAIEPGATTITLGDEELPLTNYEWEEMWSIIRSIGPETGSPSTAVSNAALQPSHRAAARKSSRPDRGEIHNSNSLHKLNSVLHPGYTDADRKRDRLIDQEEWLAHVNRNWSTVDQLWLFELEHFEGEYRIGLGRRLFGDHEADEAWEVEWFQRLSTAHSWGLSPGFKLAIQSWNSKRQPIAYHSTEPTSLLVPVVCELTPKCTIDLPRLSQACMQAVREWAHENDRWRAQPQPKAARIANQQNMLGLRAVPARAKKGAEPSEAGSEFSEVESSESEPDSAPDESATETESGEEREGTHTEVVRQHSPCESRKHLRRNPAPLPVAKVAVAPPVTAASKQSRVSQKQKQKSKASTVMHPALTSSTGAGSSSATAVVLQNHAKNPAKPAKSCKKGGNVTGRAANPRPRAGTEVKRRKQARS